MKEKEYRIVVSNIQKKKVLRLISKLMRNYNLKIIIVVRAPADGRIYIWKRWYGVEIEA